LLKTNNKKYLSLQPGAAFAELHFSIHFETIKVDVLVKAGRLQ